MSNRISLFLSESVQSTFRAFAFTHILFSVGSISLAAEIKQTFHSRDQLNKQKAASQCDTIYNFADRVPEFPGGEDSLFYFISHNLGLPFLKEKTTDTENVICSVTITQEGEVTKAEVIRSLEPEFDEEALRIIRSMPDWIPGQKQVRIFVCVILSLFHFHITGRTTAKYLSRIVLKIGVAIFLWSSHPYLNRGVNKE